MDTFYLLAFNLPGNAVKIITGIKQSIFSRTGSVSARMLPSLLPLLWVSSPPEKADFHRTGAILPKEEKGGDAFFTEPPLLKNSLYWLPVKPTLRITVPIKTEGKGLFPLFFGIPLAYAEENKLEISPEEIQLGWDETKLSWKGMTLSCYSFTSPSPGEGGKPFWEYGIVYEEIWRGGVILGKTADSIPKRN